MHFLYLLVLSSCLFVRVGLGQQLPRFAPPQPVSLGQPNIPSGPLTHPATEYLQTEEERVRRQHEALIQESDVYIEQQRRHQQTQQELYQNIENSFPEWKQQQRIAYAKSLYEQAYQKLVAMLDGSAPVSVKEAVYLVENTFVEQSLRAKDFHEPINYLLERCKACIRQSGDTLSSVTRYQALYQVLCDTTLVRDANGQIIRKILPLTYDFEDYLGQNDHRQMFVSKLLATTRGNCHSMPLLYKILADELGIPAHISFAPNHSFIRHRDSKGRWYNLEMTQGKYLSNNLFLTTGYIKAPALKSKIYLDALSDQQTVAQCLTDLAHGYHFKFGTDEFIERCAQTALQYFPHNLSALMTLFNARQARLTHRCADSVVNSMEELRKHDQLFNLYQQQEATIARIEALGHVPMPQTEYEKWLLSLNSEKQRRASQVIRNQLNE